MSVLVYTVSKLEVLFVDYVNWHYPRGTLMIIVILQSNCCNVLDCGCGTQVMEVLLQHFTNTFKQ